MQLPWQEDHNSVQHIKHNQILTFLHKIMMTHPKVLLLILLALILVIVAAHVKNTKSVALF